MVRLPSGAARFTLRITGVSPADRPLAVEIALAQPSDPESWVSLGARAMGRKHSDATFPDSELCFDITAEVHRLPGCPGRHGLRFGNFAARATGPSHGSRKHDSISCTTDRASQPMTLGWTANSANRVLHLCCIGLE
jgi:hypothetical protein